MKGLFLGGACYTSPLDQTNEKKFSALRTLGRIWVVGFSEDVRPRRFTQHARFCLLPRFPLPVLRYLLMFTVGPVVVSWLIIRHRIEIVVAQSPYEGAGAALAKIVARALGRRVALVVESHGQFEESLFLQRRILLPGLYRFLMRYAARFSFRHSDLLRAVSKSTRNQLEQWAPGKPVFQFVAWTDMEAFLQAGNEPKGEEQRILYAGALIPRKGVHHLVGAFARVAVDFPQARLNIIGREENKEYALKVRSQAHQLGLNELVEFMGEMPQGELARSMRRATVLVLPSVSEGLGRVVIEAMATGTPVVASHVGGIPDMVKDGVTGFLVPLGDEASLAGRIRWLLSHPREAREMGRHARIFAENFFSTDNYTQGYRRVFERATMALEGQRTNATSAIQPGHGHR